MKESWQGLHNLQWCKQQATATVTVIVYTSGSKITNKIVSIYCHYAQGTKVELLSFCTSFPINTLQAMLCLLSLQYNILRFVLNAVLHKLNENRNDC
jgi:hypothetical protein